MSVVFDFNASLNDVAPVFPILLPVDMMNKGKERIAGGFLLCVFLLSSQLRLSSVSVVFDFNDSLNDAAPLSPIMFTVYVTRVGNKQFVDTTCMLFVFTLQNEFCECCV